jgi:hypothetical protein
MVSTSKLFKHYKTLDNDLHKLNQENNRQMENMFLVNIPYWFKNINGFA